MRAANPCSPGERLTCFHDRNILAFRIQQRRPARAGSQPRGSDGETQNCLVPSAPSAELSWHRVNPLGHEACFSIHGTVVPALGKAITAHAVTETGLGFNLLAFKSIVLKNVIRTKN